MPMGDEERRGDPELAELTALADGSLPPARRRALEQRVAASPRLQALLREQQAALDAVRARDERAPQRLRETVERLPRSRRLPAPRLATGLAVAAVSAAALVVLALPASEPTAPTLAAAAALGTRPPTAAEPSGRGDGRTLTGPRAWGLEYPDLSRGHGWRAAGSRTDRLGERAARTVFYAHDGRRIAYTILSTGSVREQSGARSWLREGRRWYAFSHGGRTVVAWERKGHMCVVSASGVGSRALVKLITS